MQAYRESQQQVNGVSGRRASHPSRQRRNNHDDSVDSVITTTNDMSATNNTINSDKTSSNTIDNTSANYDDNQGTDNNHSIEERSSSTPNNVSIRELIVRRVESDERVFRVFVTKTLWAVTKFLNEEDATNPDCNMAHYCYRHLGIRKEDQRLWWDTHWQKMKTILNEKRSSVSQRFYKPFKGKNFIPIECHFNNCTLTLCLELLSEGSLPEMDSFISFRQNSETWTILTSRFTSIVYGQTQFARDSKTKLASEFLKASDEATTLLLLENSYDFWKKLAKQELENLSLEEDLPPTLYVERPGKGTRGGWTAAGYLRYCELYNKVKRDRQSIHATGVERRFRNSIGAGSYKKKQSSALLGIKIPYDI